MIKVNFKMLIKKLFVPSIILLFCLSTWGKTTYELDATHTQVGFKISHLVIAKVNGHFKKFKGSFKFDEKKGRLSSVSAQIDLDSIDTNEPRRDTHLKGNDFFAIRKNDGKGDLIPEKQFMTFTSSGGKIKQGSNTIRGKLKIGNKKKTIDLNIIFRGSVQDPWGTQKVAFEAKTKINRKDFGLTWNKTLDGGGLVVGEEVEILIEGEANAKKEEKKKKKKA